MQCKKRLLILSMLLATSCSAGEQGKSAENPACAALLESKCTVCHYATRICQKIGRKSKRGWERTIDNMAARGARVTADEKRVLSQCLAQSNEDVKAYCR
ncbi:MAG: hypothetical protein OEV91_07660 [Desulfobulbaceae bacterium]|nr:hypothetical protein [Desulfobulbaceae bacterium]